MVAAFLLAIALFALLMVAIVFILESTSGIGYVLLAIWFLSLASVWAFLRSERQRQRVLLSSKPETRLVPSEHVDQSIQGFYYCWNCGKKISKGQDYCWNCGKKLLHE